MLATFPILAAADADYTKIIFGVIVAIFWIIGGIASANKKKQNQGNKNWQEILRKMETASGQRPAPPTPNLPPARVPPVRRPPVRPTISNQPPRRPMPAKSPVRRPSPQRGATPPPKAFAAAPQLPARTIDAMEAKATAANVAVQAQADAAFTRSEISTTEIGAQKSRDHTRPIPRGIQLFGGGSLRSQFIALEVLQPPVALRDPK